MFLTMEKRHCEATNHETHEIHPNRSSDAFVSFVHLVVAFSVCSVTLWLKGVTPIKRHFRDY